MNLWPAFVCTMFPRCRLFVRFMLFIGMAFFGNVAAHGTITKPAFRDNPTISAGWCPWCQGEQNFCDPRANAKCAPPKPCWGETPGSTVSPEKFPALKDLIAPDGSKWIDPARTIPTWCPGDVIPIHFYIYADHNGVTRWESQLASPGMETEEAFKNFTSWQSDNQDSSTTYYALDGVTELEQGRCTKPDASNETWTPNFAHCRDNVLAKTVLKLPSDMPAGETVLRWFWYGAMKTDGKRVMGPEHSLFVNCKDVVIGTPQQCGKQTCPGGSLTSCFQQCPAETGKWDGSFAKFIGNDAFCSHCGNFGVADCSYVCAGGGSSGGGGGCDSAACSSGQYAFRSDGWNISLARSTAGGKVPYRAFAYLPFCHGAKMSSCLSTSFDFSVSFRTQGGSGWGAYVKLLFWTDSGNILGLLPPGAPGAKGNLSYRLLIFPGDDYPNKWQNDIVIQDDEWYDVKVSIQGTVFTVSVGDGKWSADLGVDASGDSNGPQLGAYSFDYGGGKRTSDMAITIGAVKGPGGSEDRHTCQGKCLAACDAGPSPPSPPLPPSPTPAPPTPSPSRPHHCCWGGSSCADAPDCHHDVFCSEGEDRCASCAGKWCPQTSYTLI